MSKIKLLKIKVGDEMVVDFLPRGFRRVSNGYTRMGDAIYIPAHERAFLHSAAWTVVTDDGLQLVSKFPCVIRPTTKGKS